MTTRLIGLVTADEKVAGSGTENSNLDTWNIPKSNFGTTIPPETRTANFIVYDYNITD